jgi:hypothetical protein
MLWTPLDFFFPAENKVEKGRPPVTRFPNGTVNWGTPGNRPRRKPINYY